MHMRQKTEKLKNLVVVSDIHAGCRLALCPPSGSSLDDGGTYKPSKFQQKMWKYWDIFWDEFVPEATKGEPFGVVVNGDAIDGVHHRATTQISHNLEDQVELAFQILQPIVELAEGRFWVVRGTEAHVGPSGLYEEALAKRLGAIPNQEGQFARYELWKYVGPKLVHFLHHIGTTGSQAYEATAVHKEFTECCIEAARWGLEIPSLIVRSHRHRYIETTIATKEGRGTAVVTPGWQGRTPFAYKIPGARLSLPQFGGIVIRYDSDSDVLYTRSKVFTIDRPEAE